MQNAKSIKGLREVRQRHGMFDNAIACRVSHGHGPEPCGFQGCFEQPGNGWKFFHVDMDMMATQQESRIMCLHFQSFAGMGGPDAIDEFGEGFLLVR